ncbi:helix-turn-helix transcriptional regulator [Microbispora bryophytorum]|uniref:Helix-turn-helix domain-containing protein n=1 Tax=Microbispora bryophytorum subsp. camponoti TaxID=1677852 RepID=A0ABR8L459_9ACTN|nr:helix-turn-helix transcriptional regulator [Microbispora camponoti]MBD3144295.1 helix-turn-helix domain-containing protein [Microbispora camponoti]
MDHGRHDNETASGGPGTRAASNAPGRRARASGRRAELGAFLRARRARLHPADVGLPEGDPALRRTPGLRREEIAELSGVGVTWYTYLEQGRDISASAQVIDALARALLLDPDEHRHLRALAGLAPPDTPETPSGEADRPRDRLRRLVDAAAPNAASVYDARFDYLAWNTPYTLLRHDPLTLPPGRRNLLWMMFTDAGNRARMVRWEPAARALISQFRAAMGHRQGDPAFTALVAELSEASPEFREWWADYPVRRFRPATVAIDHPEIGRLDLEMFQLRPAEHPDLLLVLQVPADEDGRRRVTALLDGRSAPDGAPDGASGGDPGGAPDGSASQGGLPARRPGNRSHPG